MGNILHSSGLRLYGILPTGDSLPWMSLSTGEVLHRCRFSQIQPDPAQVFLRVMAFFRLFSSLHCGFLPVSPHHRPLPGALHRGALSSSLQPNHFSPSALWGLQGFSLALCQGPKRNGCSDGSLQFSPHYPGWPHGWRTHRWFSFHPSFSTTKEISKNQKAFPKQFPLLNRFIHRGSVQPRPRAGTNCQGTLFLADLYRGHASSLVPHYWNSAKH